ncbi:MAG: glycosyltransferase [Bacteroidales bacterium]|nr:glycosyltransferase [Bacteroidales bacterium]
MKILVILPRFPFPLEKGDKLRAYHLIRTLSANNDVYLFAVSHNKVSDTDIQQMQTYCKDICIARIYRFIALFNVVRSFFSIRSMQIGYWTSRKARASYRKFETRVAPDVIFSQMVRTMKYAAHSDLPKIIDFQDALSMNLERRMRGRRGLAYFAMHYEFKMLRSAEYNATRIFDTATIISEPDSEAIPQRKDTVVHILRNGVDFDYFKPLDIEKQYDIVFCGNMQYQPNIDASRFLVNQVMPLVWQSRPETRLLLAGATPKPSVRQLASRLVTVSGSVPDIRPSYAQSRVFVAPMRIGSGLQNKLLEAMSMRIPCVTTSVANASLGAVDGTHLLIGDDAKSIADAILRLLDDKELCDTLVENAYSFVRSNFSWESAGRQLEQILSVAVSSHHQSTQVYDEFED